MPRDGAKRRFAVYQDHPPASLSDEERPRPEERRIHDVPCEIVSQPIPLRAHGDAALGFAAGCVVAERGRAVPRDGAAAPFRHSSPAILARAYAGARASLSWDGVP